MGKTSVSVSLSVAEQLVAPTTKILMHFPSLEVYCFVPNILEIIFDLLLHSISLVNVSVYRPITIQGDFVCNAGRI